MERAAEQARAAGLDGILATPGADFAYFTGYVPIITERITLLVIGAEGDRSLLVPVLERSEAEHAPGAPALDIRDWRDGEDQFAAARELLASGGRYAISDAAMALHVLGLQDALPESTFVAMSDALPLLRAIKGADEIERLAAAGAAVDACFEALAERPFAGRTERDIGAELSTLLEEHGHASVEFTVVGSGPNGANPHHELSDRVIEDGDMVVLDFGGLRDGYCSDTTRTIPVGEPTDEEREIHDVVRAAQQAGFEAVRPGAACQDVDRAARQVIEDAGYGEWFIHRTGHGIGMTVHEPPYIIEGEERPLEPGMCFSIEPGVYLPGRFGVRIEDIVVVTEDGGRRLNNSGRELRVVG
jgi:D-alanyl-D-alanine dipeptidase